MTDVFSRYNCIEFFVIRIARRLAVRAWLVTMGFGGSCSGCGTFRSCGLLWKFLSALSQFRVGRLLTTFVLCSTATRREYFSKSIRSDYISCTALVGVISADLCAWFCPDACCEYQWSMVIAIATCAHASQFFQRMDITAIKRRDLVQSG